MRIGRLISMAAVGAGVLGILRVVRRANNPTRFTGRTVVITGGSRGLGLAMARAFAEEGARLALLAETQSELERAANELAGQGAEVMTVPCDVRDRARLEDAIRRVIQRYGRIDVLVNNAGIIQVGPVEHMQVEDFENAMATHLWGPLYAMLAVIPHMKKRGGGRIVNISSIGGKLPVPHLAPYVTSKFALVGLSNSFRAELAKDNISVTTVYPMTMRTGSHYNVEYKGRQRGELNWFAVLDSLPFTSVDAEHAARLVVEACRQRDPELYIVPAVRAIAVLAEAFPLISARLFQLMNLLLPAPAPGKAGESRLGWDIRSKLVPSKLTWLNDRASEELNELAGHPPPDAH